MAIINSAVKSEWGAYYLNHEQNLKDLIKRIYFDDANGDSTIRRVTITDTVWRRAASVVGRILQSFQKQWTPISDITFNPYTTLLQKVKADVEFYPDDLEESWLHFLGANSLDRKTWPFIRWYIEMHFLPRLKQDVIINEMYFGVYVAPTAGTPGNAGNSVTGLKKRINDWITAGAATTIATGVPDADPMLWCEQVEDFAKRIPIKYRKQFPITIRMRDNLFERYKDGFNTKYNSTYMQAPFNGTIKDLPNIKVKGELMMSLSPTNLQADPAENTTENKIWATIDGNTYELVQKPANMNAVRLDDNGDRLVKIFTDFYLGFDFEDPTIVYSNDQNLA